VLGAGDADDRAGGLLDDGAHAEPVFLDLAGLSAEPFVDLLFGERDAVMDVLRHGGIGHQRAEGFAVAGVPGADEQAVGFEAEHARQDKRARARQAQSLYSPAACTDICATFRRIT
jgi:hypothetical protein